MSANCKCILFATTTILCFLGLSTRLALALTITDGFETTRLQQCREGCLEKVCVTDACSYYVYMRPLSFPYTSFSFFSAGILWMKWHEGWEFLQVACGCKLAIS